MHISRSDGTRGLLVRTILLHVKTVSAVRCIELLYASRSTQWEGKRAPGRDLMHLARCYIAVGQYEHMTILPRRPLSKKIKRKIIMNELTECSSFFTLATCIPLAYTHPQVCYFTIKWINHFRNEIIKKAKYKNSYKYSWLFVKKKHCQ